MDRKPNRKRRIRSIVIAIAIIVVSGTLVTILNLGQVFAEEILGELVQRQTKGYYALNFDKIQVDLIEREIQVKQLYLKADSSKISEETDLNTVYEIQLSNLVINIKSLFKFYVQKKLEIESMRIVDPEIRMQRIGERTSTSFSFETGNLYKAISDYLTVLKVDYFRIQDGDLKYNSDQFSVGNIDFQIQNLLLDSVVRNDVFYSETIFLEVQNQKYFLPDSIHEIEFDRFVLSTKDSILRFENLSIHPTMESGIQFGDENDVNVYDINIPVLALKGIDYQSAYRKDHLVIDELSFTRPTILIDDETHGKAKKEKDDNSLLNLLFTVFHKIEIGKFSVEDSEIDLKINSDKTYQRIQSEETSISFYNIVLDSTNYQFNQRTRYFENVEISVNNYDYVLPDSIHEVRFETLKISSEDSLLSLRNLEISDVQNSEHESFINLNIPSIDLYGFVYDDMIDKNLTVRDLLIDRVYFKLNGSKEKSKGERDVSITSIYDTIEPIFNEISIGQFTIGKAELDLPDGITVGNATFDLEGFELNSSTRSLEDLFDLSYISLRDLNIERDSIRIRGNEAKLSHDLTDMELTDWKMLVNTGELDLDGEFHSLKVVDLNPDSLLHGNFMTFRKVFIESPKFDIAKQGSSSAEEKNGLGIEKEILITDGHFVLSLDSFSTSVELIDVDFYLGDSIAIHDIDARKISSSFQKQNHELNLGQLSYDTLKDEMHFLDIEVKPIDHSDSSQSLLNASIPEIKINGFIQDQFFDQNKLTAKELFIDKPDIEFYQVKNEKQKSSSNLEVRIADISLSSGEFAISGISEEMKEIVISDFNSSIEGLNYPSSNSLFYSDELRLDISSILPNLVSGDQASIGNLTFNSATNSLSIDSILFQKANESLELMIPNTSIDNLAVKRLIENGELIATDLTINNPSISLIRMKKEKLTKPKHKQTPSIPINLNELNLNNISLSYHDTLNKKTYEVNDALINLTSINHSGDLDFVQILQNTDDFRLSGNSLNIPINKFYSLETANYFYDSKLQKLAFSNVHFNPLYSKTEYTKFLEEQKDWFEASTKELMLQGVDVVEIVNDSLFRVESISLDGTNLFIYRDKHLPFPKDQVGLLPTEQILSIPFPTQVDTISIKGDVAYEEQPDDFEQTGIITFDNIDAQILNFTNVDVQTNTIMQLNATGEIVEEGNFKVNAQFELGQQDQRFSFDGIVKDLPLDSLNQMLGPVASINIKDGFAEEIKFRFLANDSLATGEMTFLYKDLKLQVLNAKKHETNLKSGLMSFFANTFVIHKKNPRFLFPRKGTIYHKRDTSKAIFNYWGKSILSGAVSSVGIHKSDRQERRDSKVARKEE